MVEAVKRDYTTAALSPADRALMDYVVKLTKQPWAMTAADVDALRAVGFEDRAIHDACQVASYFNYINRIADGLHVDLDPGMAPHPQAQS